MRRKILSRPAGLLCVAAVMMAGAGEALAENDSPIAIEHAGVSLEGLTELPVHVGGRVVEMSDAAGNGDYQSQWPGTYYETAFEGAEVLFGVGGGDMHLAVSVDGAEPVHLLRPAPGLHAIQGLSAGKHELRVQIINESAAPVRFDGVFAPAGTRAGPLPERDRQIEFIGDSWTAAYANTSTMRQCTGEMVWETTDAGKGIAGLLGTQFGADYQINAISGRGIVRNYNGGAGDTLPQAYPYALLDHETPYEARDWSPDVTIVSLGTNDFSTPVGEGEEWTSRAALTQDFIDAYTDFVGDLRERHPGTYFILWASQDNDEVRDAARAVVARLQAEGEEEIGFVPVSGLTLEACHWHPGLADDERIAEALAAFIAQQPGIWE